ICQVNILCIYLLQFVFSFCIMIFVVLTNDFHEKTHLELHLGGVKMANIKSSIKRVKTNEKANLANSQAKSAMRTAVKKAEQAIAAGAENAQELVVQATKALDKGVSK